MIITALAASLFLSAHPAAAAVQTTEAPERVDIGNGLHAIFGRGGNILFSVGEDGTFVVDDQFADNAAQNIALIRDVSKTAIVFVLNTHHHGDHAGGNPVFARKGATILAHDNVRARLKTAVDEGKMDASGLPVITFSDSTTFYWNDKEVYVFHIPNAHTDGDALVHFRKANVIHTGDTMFAGRYPFIDLSSGGSVDGAIAALQAVYDLSNDETVIVPGHGPLSTKAEVKATMEMISSARALVRAEMMKGMTRDAVIAAAPLKSLDETYSWQFINGERFTGTLFDDLMATDADAKAAITAAAATVNVPMTATLPPPAAPTPAAAPTDAGMASPAVIEEAAPTPSLPEMLDAAEDAVTDIVNEAPAETVPHSHDDHLQHTDDQQPE